MGRYAELLEEVRGIVGSGMALPGHRVAIADIPSFTPEQIKKYAWKPT